MNKNKILTIVFISIVGVGLFILFINILSEEEVETPFTDDIVAESVEEEAPEAAEVSEVSPTIEESSEVEEENNFEEALVGENVYSAFVEYLVPKGFRDSIDVYMEVEDGLVTDVSIVQVDSNPESTFYQEQFRLQYREEVVGKNIEDIDLSRIGGASLTTMAFMDAVDEIRSKL